MTASSLPLSAEDSPSEPQDISSGLQPILKKSKLPSLAALAIVRGEVVAQGAVGVRKLGDETAVTVADRFHLGSCTKSFTATLVAILVEEDLLDWETTIGEVLGSSVEKIHGDYEAVTVEQLLAHVGGLAGSSPSRPWRQAWDDQGKIEPREQRLRFVTSILQAKPKYRPGTKTIYSNQGYAVVGSMLEKLTGKPWEELIEKRIFEPLGMENSGFRAPGSAALLDHPWGHEKKKPMSPDSIQSDNPDAIGPAGTIHCTLSDWAKFVAFHQLRKTGTLLKKEESFERLHRTLPKSGKHAVGGWLEVDMPPLGGRCIQMAGSNTLWFSLMWIVPEKEMAFIACTNSGAASAFTTCDKAIAELMLQFGAFE